MKHSLVHAYTWHTRSVPMEHSFSYRYTCLYLDLDSLDSLNAMKPLLSRNSILSCYQIREDDYLSKESWSLRKKLEAELSRRGVTERFAQITLMTAPRFLGYVFNPVSFYFCFRENGSLGAFVAEVNNTFRDKHIYVIPLSREQEYPYRVKLPKSFHVSPFFDTDGEFAFEIRPPDKKVSVLIDYWKDDVCVFRSGVTGKLTELTRWSLLTHMLSRPFFTWLTMPRILYQAARLYYLRRLPVYTRPNPVSEDTIRHAPATAKQRWCMSLVSRVLCKIEHGTLIFKLPDDTELLFPGRVKRDPKAVIRIRNYDAFVYLLLRGDVGAGEAYEAGYWEAEDLTAVLSLIVANQHVLEFRNRFFSMMSRLLNRLGHVRRKNSVLGSRRNIAEHYDLSNDFFESFLDQSMTYSSALYRHDADSLYDAQRNKLLSIIHQADIQADHHVLEIGCGWGSLAMTAVEETGCTVTCLTLSKEQKKLAEERIAAAGLSDRITILLQDYRHHQGSYDRIVSVEMLEAVGKKYLKEYFSCCNRLLKRNGITVIQVITIPEERKKRYATACDWIQKYIFPGCYVPPLSEVVSAAAEASLSLESTNNIALHYAKTLHAWQKRSSEQRERYVAEGKPLWFLRRWEYYLAYCEAGFATRMLGTHQLVLSRQNNASLGSNLHAEDYVSQSVQAQKRRRGKGA